MTSSPFFEKLIRITESDVLSKGSFLGHNYICISPSNLIRIMTSIKDHSELKMEQLVDIIAIDYPNRLDRFEVIYHLLSHRNGARIFIKVNVKKDAILPSLTNVFENANWYEREIFDLMGINFSDHPDLRRLLTDYNFEGHPLRKDFPLSGYTQVHYNTENKKVDYEPVNLQQSYRNFDHISPWEGVLRKK
jgi:NADH-quinone oxidoreductase subunit C